MSDEASDGSPAAASPTPDTGDMQPISADAARRLEALRTLRPGQVAIGVGCAVVVTVVLVAAVGRLAGFTELGDTLNGAAWGWLGLCAIGQVGVFGGYAGAFRSSVADSPDGAEGPPGNIGDDLCRSSTTSCESTGAEGPPGNIGDDPAGEGTARPRIAVWYSLKVALAGFGLTQLVAAGGAAGMAFTFWVLRRIGFSKRSAMVELIALNTAVYFVFGILGWLGALGGLVDTSVPLGMVLGWLIGFPVVVGLALWFTQPRRLPGRMLGDDAPRIRRALTVGVSAAARVRRATGTGQGRRLLAWSLLYWAGDLVSLWAALRAFGAAVSPAAIVGAYATGYLAQSVPIPLIATGGVDAATTFALAAVGVPIEVALLGVVAHRVFAFWLPLMPGLWSATVLVRHEMRPAEA